MFARRPMAALWNQWHEPDANGDPRVSVVLPPNDAQAAAAIELAAMDCREALAGLASAIRLGKAPPANISPLREISGFAPADQASRRWGDTITLNAWVADTSGRVWPRTPTYWKFLYLHETAHMILADAIARGAKDDKWSGGHAPLFSAVELVMLIRHDLRFPESPRLGTKATLYDFGFDQIDRLGPSAMLAPSPSWRGNETRDWGWTFEWAIRTAQRLAVTDLTVEQAADVVVARWLRIIKQWKRARAYAMGQMRAELYARRAGFQAGQDAAVAAMRRRATAALREREQRRRRRAWVAVSGAFVVAGVVGVLVAFL